jgi:hypothetical protein
MLKLSPVSIRTYGDLAGCDKKSIEQIVFNGGKKERFDANGAQNAIGVWQEFLMSEQNHP